MLQGASNSGDRLQQRKHVQISVMQNRKMLGANPQPNYIYTYVFYIRIYTYVHIYIIYIYDDVYRKGKSMQILGSAPVPQRRWRQRQSHLQQHQHHYHYSNQLSCLSLCNLLRSQQV